jgi:phage terminase small subunit
MPEDPENRNHCDMPALRNTRHERFANEIVAGKSAAAAYLVAGYKADRRTAWQARHRPDVSRRIEELIQTERRLERQATERAAAKYEVTAERVIGELAKIAFGNVLDLIEIDANGEPHVNLAAVTYDQAAGLQELSIEEVRAGNTGTAQKVRRIKIKLADKLSALVALGKHLGLFVDPSLLNVNVANYFSEKPPTMEEWKAEIEGQSGRFPQ